MAMPRRMSSSWWNSSRLSALLLADAGLGHQGLVDRVGERDAGRPRRAPHRGEGEEALVGVRVGGLGERVEARVVGGTGDADAHLGADDGLLERLDLEAVLLGLGDQLVELGEPAEVLRRGEDVLADGEALGLLVHHDGEGLGGDVAERGGVDDRGLLRVDERVDAEDVGAGGGAGLEQVLDVDQAGLGAGERVLDHGEGGDRADPVVVGEPGVGLDLDALGVAGGLGGLASGLDAALGGGQREDVVGDRDRELALQRERVERDVDLEAGGDADGAAAGVEHALAGGRRRARADGDRLEEPPSVGPLSAPRPAPPPKLIAAFDRRV
jgi:hypothetical protein